MTYLRMLAALYLWPFSSSQRTSPMIRPCCDRCRDELDDYGAILLGPPDAEGRVRKRHLCSACYEEIVEEMVR